MTKKKKEKKTQKVHSKVAPNKNTLKGTIEMSRSGMAFVIVEGLEKDVKVKPHHIGKAFNGDIVEVEVDKHASFGSRLEGKVTNVLERKTIRFVGKIQVSAKFAFFVVDGQRNIPDFFIPLENIMGALNGQRVVVELTEWGKGDNKPMGKVVEVVTAADENNFAMREIITEAGFSIGFSDEIEKETASLNATISKADLKARKDFRKILTFTIDPIDAKDFDDALSIQFLQDGNIEIGVHIADVSHFVKPGTALDKEAYQRATSVYLPDRVNPMLPEKISNELCSLRPKEDKFTFSAVFIMSPKAEIISTWIGRTLIHSDHRFTYEDVQEIIENKEGLHLKEIVLLDEIAKKIRAKRFKNGAINFSSQEVRFKLDEKGFPLGIVIKVSKDAHKLIEEFMLLANKAVAEYMGGITYKNQSVPFPYRVHDTPDDEKLAPFAAFAKKFGYSFELKNKKAIAKSFNELLAAVQGKPEQAVLEQLGIRTMAKAAYTINNIGHYGLGFENYCHFTSPIRRYPDVLVHRVLQQCLDKKIEISEEMESYCVHCSERERKAMEAERASNKYKQVEFMQQHLGEEFDGVISGVTSFGLFVETIEHKCEGLVSIKDLLLVDDFRQDEANYALIGLRSKKQFRMGDVIRIKVVSANLAKRQLDLEWVSGQVKASKTGLIKTKNKKK